MKFLKNLFTTPVDENVNLTFNLPQFSPEEDITAYEVAQYLLLKKSFVFKGSPSKLQNEIMEWYKSLPLSLVRHYVFVKRTIEVSKSLIEI